MGTLIERRDTKHRAFIGTDSRGIFAYFTPKTGQSVFIYETEAQRNLAVKKWLKKGEYRNPRRALEEYFGVHFRKDRSSFNNYPLYYSNENIPLIGYSKWIVFYDEKPFSSREEDLYYFGLWTFQKIS